MVEFRLVRSFSKGVTPSTEKAYRVETTELLTEKEALALVRELGSPYKGKKYDA